MSVRSRAFAAAAWMAAVRRRLPGSLGDPARYVRLDGTTAAPGQADGALDYVLEHLFSYYITVGPPEYIGIVPDGLRINFHITGGEVTGPRVFGKVRPVGADWINVRRDGIGIIAVRGVMETQDGVLIDVIVDGIMDLGEDAHDSLAAGGPPPTPTRFRTRLQFRCADPRYAWLNRLYCIGVGEGRFTRFRVDYDVYAVR